VWNDIMLRFQRLQTALETLLTIVWMMLIVILIIITARVGALDIAVYATV